VRRPLKTVLATLLAVSFLAAACGRASTSAPTTTAKATATTEAPQPAGANPSEIAKMVCAAKAQAEIQRVLGVTAHVSVPTWRDHRYTCRYEYPSGAFVLSVQELSSWTQTTSYYTSLGTSMGDTGKLGNLGQGAFTTSDGSVVVRKDWKVLLVDIAPLSKQFGNPPTSRADVAYTVAALILGCWEGD
jgi:curli biogenesis system outer membrane secretion channel CsgG